jgi:hypothetical protein
VLLFCLDKLSPQKASTPYYTLFAKINFAFIEEGGKAAAADKDSAAAVADAPVASVAAVAVAVA